MYVIHRWGMSALDYAALYSSQDDKHIFKALKLHKFLHSRRKKVMRDIHFVFSATRKD